MYLKNILSIIMAFILASIGGVLIIAIFMPLKMWLVPADFSTSIHSDKELMFYLFLSIFVYIWSGFIIAKISKVKQLMIAMLYPCLGILYWFVIDIEFPTWYVISSIILSFPLTYWGAKLYLNETIKSTE